MNNRVLQIRTDALVAEYIYTEKLSKLGYVSTTITCLTVLVPIMFSAAILIVKGTSYESALNTSSIVLSAVLLSLSVMSLILKLDQKRESFLIARRSNIYVSSEALKLIEKEAAELSWFYNYLAEIDSRDQGNIGEVTEKLKKEAYRRELSYKKRPCPMSYAGPQAEFSFLALHRRRPLVSNSSLERTFRASLVPVGKSILAERRPTQSRYMKSPYSSIIKRKMTEILVNEKI